MSRLVNVQDSAYKLSVLSNGTITLDTGNQIGEVIVTGNLTVLGTQTTVNTTNLDIEDNLLTLNKGEGGNGITEVVSGIQIDRGSNPDYPWAQFIFDETIPWLDLQSGGAGTSRVGSFVLKTNDGALNSLQLVSITTDGTDLNLLGAGSSVLTVTGTVNYERNVLDYTTSGLPAKDDDIIPNIKAVIDYITEYFVSNPPFKIQDSTRFGTTTTLFDSLLEIHDAESDGGSSNLILQLDGVTNALWYSDRHTVQDLEIAGSTITCTNESADLVLQSPGLGSVKVNDNLKLSLAGTAPEVAVDGTKIYANDEAQGGTGIFFVNTDNTRDELISKRKSIVYSMIF